MKQQVPEWTVGQDNRTILRTFTFKNFDEAMAFVSHVAKIAQTENHHPDINLHDYKKVTISLSTHAIGGLSENDFIVAAKVDAVTQG